jgi:glycerol dehydrogenase
MFAASSRYVQGPDAFDCLAELLEPYGPALVITDRQVQMVLAARLDEMCSHSRAPVQILELPGEITDAAVSALRAAARPGTGVVVGLGGGKVLDAAKAVALRLQLPVITVPSIASNDSPASAAIAMYDEQHVLIRVDRLARHPDVVLVDTALIARAPVGFLLAGIGDAISKTFEAQACWAGTGTVPVGGRPLRVAGVVADGCYRVIRAHAVDALEACRRGVVTDALEATVEAVVLMSGLGFENGGLSLAHALTRGLVVARGADHAPHGWHVAWGLLVQLAAEPRPDAEILDVAGFLRGIGLPTTLADLGMIDPTPEEIDEIGELAMTAAHVRNMPRPIDRALVASAIHHVEELAGWTGERQDARNIDGCTTGC